MNSEFSSQLCLFSGKKDGPKPRCLGGNVGHVKGPRDTFCFHSWGAQGSSIEGLKDMVLRRPLKPSSRSVELRWDGTFWGCCSSPWLQFTSSFLMFLVSWHLLHPNACFPWRKHLKTNLIMDDFGIIIWYKWIDITGTLKHQVRLQLLHKLSTFVLSTNPWTKHRKLWGSFIGSYLDPRPLNRNNLREMFDDFWVNLDSMSPCFMLFHAV